MTRGRPKKSAKDRVVKKCISLRPEVLSALMRSARERQMSFSAFMNELIKLVLKI